MNIQKLTELPLVIFSSIIVLFYSSNTLADTATATQSIRIVIPKVALIDTDNTDKPLSINFNPISDAGNNFTTVNTTGTYSVTSNIPRLRLYAQTDKNLADDYNLQLKVKETKRDGFKSLSTTAQRISTQGKQKQSGQLLYYQAQPISPNKTIPYGDINVKVTYTLVEP